MALQLLMGNEAIALGAIRAGVGVVTGYPGTPSTEVLESVAKHNDGKIYVEWSVNEKAAMEVAAGAAYAGQRTLVTMKQVGLNVASDPLMSLSYVGVKGGMVVFVADDPGPISSQTEQDTRHFAEFSKLPIFDPVSPEEAYLMMADAFALSEELHTPVLFRATTRICHACASIDTDEVLLRKKPEGFIKDPKWVIFPRLSYQAHLSIEDRNRKLSDTFSRYRYNQITGSGSRGIVSGGVSTAYVREALAMLGAQNSCKQLSVATPHPFPEQKALEFLQGLEEVLVCEELDPVLEKALVLLCGKHHLPVKIRGKLTGDAPQAGENSVEDLYLRFIPFLGIGEVSDAPARSNTVKPPVLPVRPPVLCAGCPHRASFYAVKRAMKGKKAVFCGDIGCYTLGNALPLDMTDTCLCMGAGITIAQGIRRVQPDTFCFSFTGDSTFFHTGIPGIANAVYNGADMIAVILDNSSTAMTGHQPNPSTGKNAMGEVAQKISIEAVLTSLGVSSVQTVDPFDLEAAEAAVTRAAGESGVRAIVFRAPCISVCKPKPPYTVHLQQCVNCGRCIRELGCPAISRENDTIHIHESLCYGCGLCAKVCPTGAIRTEGGTVHA